MSNKIRKIPQNRIESESEEEEDSTIESSFNESNAANVSRTSSKSDLEIPATDEEIEESYIEESSNRNLTENERSSSVSHSQNLNESQLDNSEHERHSTAANESDQSGSDDSSDDDIVVHRRHNLKNRIADDSSDDEEEEKVVEKRRTLYMEEPEGDLDEPVEDQAFSKATRRSIFGGPSIKKEAVSYDNIDPDASDSEGDIIISSDSEDEERDKENFERGHSSQLSSTLRSPLKDASSLLNSSNELSPPGPNVKEEPLDVSEQNAKKTTRVARFVYEEECRKRDSLKSKIRMAENNTLLHQLPDGGVKLLASIQHLKKELEEITLNIDNMVIDEEESISNRIKRSINEDSSYIPSASEDDMSYKEESSAPGPSRPTNYLVAEDVLPKHTGKVGMKNFLTQKALTVEALQDIHQSIDERPSDDAVAEPPKYLKITLMKHQLHAIKFMMWRESQTPRGGLLADDMGLGKTLTAIALVMKQQQIYEEQDDSDESEDEGRSEWIAQGRKDLRAGGTLIICPASLMNQWEDEIKNKVKRGALDVCVFHGNKRPVRARELAKYDVVITTYQIVVSEHKNNGCIFGLRWDRIILDEGHVIRNHRSKQNEAVCALEGKKRWVLTGTPVHNKEFDMYAVIKFLRCSPFDDLQYWKTWIECGRKNNNSPRLQTLLKSILLRRTKKQLMESGEIQTLPEKIFEEVKVELNPEERKVYFKVAAYSKAVFSQYLLQHQQKHNNFTYDQTQVAKWHSKLQKAYRSESEVKQTDILVLLLRMRQVCCHAGLIKKALSDFGLDNDEVEGMNKSSNESDGDILRQLQDLKITDADGQGVVINDDVFNMDIPSSKLEKLMEILKEKLEKTDDKIIVVSQWISFLDIVKGMLEIEDISVCELSGRIPVKKRNDIVVDFNKKTSKTRVMLLSITAGGVGLNLVGANMLFILDPHWNPQIEQQAQDRIYRFGQEKNVKIIKFICDDTIEEHILAIQKNKLEVATSTLTGSKCNATKLTLDDLKTLFGMNNAH